MLVVLFSVPIFILAQHTRWQLSRNGGIAWHPAAHEIHSDHIEMSGKQLSVILTYGVDSLGKLQLAKKLVFPMLRTIPHDTRGSLIRVMNENPVDSIKMGGRFLRERPVAFYIHGYLEVESLADSGLHITRQVFPSTEKAACIERFVLKNKGKQPLRLHIPTWDKSRTDTSAGVYGHYTINTRLYNGGDLVLEPSASYSFSVVTSGSRSDIETAFFSAEYEWEKRQEFINGLEDAAVLKTPNDTINRMFSFAKIRAAESIFDTKEGLMHAPGGGEYYAAIWANDQAEYVNPFFPFIGYVEGIESARNSFRLFARYMNPEYKPIPSSIIAEGTGFWNGAGDRGDQAMIAYGASMFALYYADHLEAVQLWPLISWCNEYLLRKTNSHGLVLSDSDELEGRFETDSINLSTNVLAYGAFVYASRLADALNLHEESERLSQRAARLRNNIGQYFGAEVEGFNTYRYNNGNKHLRSWICMPLVMGMLDRKDGTVNALLSSKLWTKNGLLTESGSTTFWDRSTLYAFRGLFKAGATDTTITYFNYYSAMRLLGDHVPYAIEAWPEGDQRHLSAESGLYCRAVIEGLFGFDPMGFNSFTLCPRLPLGWNSMALSDIRAFGRRLSIEVRREKKVFRIQVKEEARLTHSIIWDGKSKVKLQL